MLLYDGSGAEIGIAARAKDKYAATGSRYHYDVRDTALRCVVRDVSARRYGIFPGRPTFTVLGPDGGILGSVRRERGLHDYAVDCEGPGRASLRRVSWRKAAAARPQFAFADVDRRSRLIDRLGSRVWYVIGEWDQRIAQITHLFASGTQVAYVLERERTIAEPMRTLALALVIVIDNRITDNSSG